MTEGGHLGDIDSGEGLQMGDQGRESFAVRRDLRGGQRQVGVACERLHGLVAQSHAGGGSQARGPLSILQSRGGGGP